MHNYNQQIPIYNQPIEFLYARGVNGQPGIGPFVNGVRQTMQGINGMGPMGQMGQMGQMGHMGQIQNPYIQSQQPQMRPQIMQIEEGK
jgi:hypothetical protein